MRSIQSVFQRLHKNKLLSDSNICKAKMATDPSLARPKVLMTHEGIPQSAVDILSVNCELVTCFGRPYASRQVILEKAAGVDAVFWASKERLDKEFLDAAGPTLRAIGTMSAGTDHLDVAEIKARGITLGNTPKVLDTAVADVAVGLVIGTARRFQEGRKQIDNSTWTFGGPQMFLGRDIANSTVGIVGLGGIGQAIVKRLMGFEVATFLYTGHNRKPEGDALGAKFVSFEKLLAESDFVIAACPLTPETNEMFNESAFNQMKDTAIFINISRGGVVDQDALVTALRENKIYGAGLDVMTPEPIPKDHPLCLLPNCMLLPHVGSATLNTRSDMATLTAHNILRGLAGEPLLSPV